ncbi:MAG: Hint domain-containing protein [Myxococcales bacterium]
MAATGGDFDAALGYAEWGTTIGGVASQFMVACFAAGTPILTPEGSKAIEEIKVGDLVLSRDELEAR